jgi:hypothetical protein
VYEALQGKMDVAKEEEIYDAINQAKQEAISDARDEILEEIGSLRLMTMKGIRTLAEGQTPQQWLGVAANVGTPKAGDVWVFPNATDDGKTEEWVRLTDGTWQLLGVRNGGQAMSVRVIDEDEDPDDYELVIG